MKLSVVIPFFDEDENAAPVLREVRQLHPDAEIIAVDDHSSDGTFEALCALRGEAGVIVHRLRTHLGQSAAIYAGLVRASGDVVVVMDGDGQSDPSDIKRLLEHFPHYDFVNGRRLVRNDARSRVLASRLANAVRNRFTLDGMQDTCGTPKAMKRECVAHLVPFDGLHRFIPALLERAGFRICEIPVTHRARLHGATKYTNLGRGVRGLWDLVGVRWLLQRRFSAHALEHAEQDDREI